MILTTRSARLLLVFQVLLLFVLTIDSATIGSHDYCIIGAGPSGLQLGYYMEKAKRDYIIFERSNTSGNFYVKYPRHRKLISINKRHTGQTNKEFNMRHDWNSLLSHDDSLLLRHYSKEMFPHADVLLKYLKDYKEKLGIQVQFNTEISNIHTVKNESAPDGHLFYMNDQTGKQYICRTLIAATGMWKPNIPEVPGIEYTEGYEDVSLNPEEFEGQTVLVLGRGNAAFETADHIMGSTNLIHMVARSRVRLSWATHYVGDLRAINNGLLDTYQLKSLDGVLEAAINEVKIVKRNGKLFLDLNTEDEEEESLVYLDNFAMREPYDRIIRCLGFKFDMSIFRNDTDVIKKASGLRISKFPSIMHNYESTTTKGMFVAGTASHSLDHRKSAGGFIHGFRYTARALHHILESRYEGVIWPHKTYKSSELVNVLLKRMNEASGTYQMFSVLGDVVVFRDNRESFEYYEEFPINLLHEFTNITGAEAGELIAVVLQYGANFSGPGNDIFRTDRATGEPSEAHKSNFLHPVLYYYKDIPTAKQMKTKKRSEILPRPHLMHHIVEDFLTMWDAPISHVLPLRRFIEDVLQLDIRHYYMEDCFRLSLLHSTVPSGCQPYLNGQGLSGTGLLIESALKQGLLM
ncbi:FAD-dependent oxidoreductase domain-containing protein 2 [Patella vulgata]|uniref:FAD-dependent oxidoreductase domain-containing protein 2 n=1 Tax=Patella vulgata TaxID=6465 RepID=UPI0024A863EC|nr:FAD-dependent oxidoreductase domain-containing protein 2 [Patella vulgata]XP_050391341.2 FAD-dependent oxidoreductase domain-containing protein 2 [Patella vulgata]